MKRYLKDGTPIDPDIRKTIRQIADFLPEAAQIDYELALHCHENGNGNCSCRYHARTKCKDCFDGYLKSPYVNNGAPFPSRLGKSGQAGIAHPGCMHCGCSIAEVLVEFYFFKTWTIVSLRPDFAALGREEGWGGTYLTTRQRAFLVQAMQKYAGITIDNIYSGDVHGPTADHDRQIIVSQIEHLVRTLNAKSPAVTYSLHSVRDNKYTNTVVPESDTHSDHDSEEESNAEDVDMESLGSESREQSVVESSRPESEDEESEKGSGDEDSESGSAEDVESGSGSDDYAGDDSE